MAGQEIESPMLVCSPSVDDSPTEGFGYGGLELRAVVREAVRGS